MPDRMQFEGRIARLSPSPAEAHDKPSRKSFLKRAALAGGTVIAGGAIASGLPELPAVGRPSRSQDKRILGFLLSLERIQAAFYEQAAGSGRLSGELQQFAELVGGQEQEHVEFLEKTLGSGAKAGSFDFGDAVRDAKKFAASAVQLEEIATAAYIGQGPSLRSDNILDVARITSVEARHAAWMRDILGRLPAPRAADIARSPKQVREAIRKSGFVQS
jgi:hypothetical protein